MAITSEIIANTMIQFIKSHPWSTKVFKELNAPETFITALQEPISLLINNNIIQIRRIHAKDNPGTFFQKDCDTYPDTEKEAYAHFLHFTSLLMNENDDTLVARTEIEAVLHHWHRTLTYLDNVRARKTFFHRQTFFKTSTKMNLLLLCILTFQHALLLGPLAPDNPYDSWTFFNLYNNISRQPFITLTDWHRWHCRTLALHGILRPVSENTFAEIVNILDDETLLHQAARCDNQKLARKSQDAVRELIEKKHISLDAPNETGHTALYVATRNSNAEIATMLFNAGARPNTQDITRLDSKGCTMLHYAAKLGEVALIKHLIEAGANYDHPDSLGNTPLHYASHYGKDAAIFTLINNAHTVKRYDKNTEGKTPYDLIHLRLRKNQDLLILLKPPMPIQNPDQKQDILSALTPPTPIQNPNQKNAEENNKPRIEPIPTHTKNGYLITQNPQKTAHNQTNHACHIL